MAAEQAILSNVGQPHKSAWFLPREHGATAMLFMPIVCAAILAREWRWSEVATLTAAFSALAAKDPMVTLARQRFIWKTRHPETAAGRAVVHRMDGDPHRKRACACFCLAP